MTTKSHSTFLTLTMNFILINNLIIQYEKLSFIVSVTLAAIFLSGV